MSELRDISTRTIAFARKELYAILRQPRLLATLILGPFLILALFGVGYQQKVDALATVLVAPADSEFIDQLEQESSAFEDRIALIGTVHERSEAVAQLRSGVADVAVIVPDSPIESIRNGERAVFTVLHDQLDPFEQATISLISRTTVDLVNRRLLEELVASGQAESEDVGAVLPAARESATALRKALETADRPTAEAQRRSLARQLDNIEQQTVSTEVLVESIRDQFASESTDSSVVGSLDSLGSLVDGVDPNAVGESLEDEIEEARKIETQLEELSERIADFRSIPPDILVSPFGAQSSVVGSVDLDITSFYAPGVIALLIQHIGITFGGLALVRERALGTSEVFRVSPVHAAQILAGKYIGYMVAIGVVAVALSLLMFGAFGVPLAGDIGSYTIVLLLLALASLGIGFVISGVVASDTQAVNVAMIVLLLSIFFSGFFLSLERLVSWVTVVSWSLPITHAIDSLRDVMFRAEAVELRTLWALGFGSIALFIAGLYALQRRLRAE
ncbi:MAG: ABC transporter permease [Acidimicrobiia bacterium]|nr:ABC transporter permease [Acidimicrobiia bacterium]